MKSTFPEDYSGPKPGGGSSPDQYAIFCQGLTKHYGEVHALEALDLAVPVGSIFGFLGRNGAGKSTTMRILAGLSRPTAGRAWIAGQESNSDNRLVRTRFGYLPQDPAFYRWMSAREYLDYVAQIQGISRSIRERQVNQLLDTSGLIEAAGRSIQGYSGGMIQRLGIAQALIGDPPVLLLDEPTSALDPAGRQEVLEMIAALRGKVTVFLSSHILTDIERVCDTVAVLHKGCLVLVSDREALLSEYSVNAVELELDPQNRQESIDNFLQSLNESGWVSEIYPKDKGMRIMVRDVQTAKSEILSVLTTHGLIVNRYEWIRPSLEEIFLKLSS